MDQLSPAPSQLDTFRGWINLKLREANFRSPLPPERRVVRDMSRDLCDGVLLAELCGSLMGLREPLKIHYQPRVSSRKIENIHTSLTTMQQQGVRLPQIGAEDILRGDLRAISGLAWSLIVRYQLSGDGKRPTTKKAVLIWIRAALPNENIPDLATSWNDGILLSKLIAYLAPTSHTLLDPSNHTATCGMLLSTAKRELGVSDIISAEAMSSPSIEEEAVCTYLSLFSVAMSASLVAWLRGLLGPSGPRGLSPEEWRNGDLLGKLIQVRTPDTAGTERDLSELFDLLRDRMDITPPVSPRDLREGKVDLVSLQTLLLLIRNARTESVPSSCSAVGRGLLTAVVGERAEFSVETRAAGKGQLTVLIRYRNGDTLEHAARQDNRAYHVSYSSTRAGAISVAVMWGGKHIPNSPFSILATDPTAVRLTDRDNMPKEIQVAREHEVLVRTKGAGEGELTAQVLYPSQQLEQLPGLRRGDGIFALILKPKKEGEVTLHILWNNSPIQDSPVQFSALLPPSYQLDPASPPRDSGTGDLLSVPVRETFCLCVRSQRGPLSRLSAEVRHSQTGQLLPVATETHQNFSNLWVTPDRIGLYRISLLAGGEHVAGSPLSLPVSDARQILLVSPATLPRCLQLGCPMELTLTAAGAGPAELRFHCQRGVDCTINRTGDSIVALLLPESIGEFVCSFKWGSEHIKDSPFRVTVCDITQVSVTSEVLEGELGIIGQELEFIILYELAGASADNDVTLRVSARGPTADCPVEIQEEGLGHTVASLTPREAGEHELEVLLGDIELEQSPIYFDIIASDTMDITAYGNGLQRAESGAVSEFFIRARQSGALEADRLGVRVHSIHGEVRHWLEDRGEGEYRVEYTPKRPGAYLVEVSMDGASISGSPYKVSVRPNQSQEYIECLLSGPALNPDNKFTLGQPVDFTVDATRAPPAQLMVSAVGEREGVSARVVMHQYRQGFYQVNLDPPEVGLYSVSVQYGDRQSPDSPFSVEISPSDTDSSQCRAYGPGLAQAKVGERTEFFVSTHEAGRGALAVTVEGFSRSFVVYVDPTPEDSKLLCCRYKPKSSGAYSIALKWSGQNIPGSPFHLEIRGKDLLEGSGVSLPDSLADSVRPAQPPDPEGYVSSDDNTSLGDYTRPPPTPQAPPVPLPPSRLLIPSVPRVPSEGARVQEEARVQEGAEDTVLAPRGRVLAQITQFEKQAKTEEPIAGRRASEKWRTLRRGTQGGTGLSDIKETAVKQPTEQGVNKVADARGVNKVADLKGVDKVADLKGVDKVADLRVSEAAPIVNIQRGVVSSLVKRSEELQQRASILESPSPRPLREGAHVKRTKEQLTELSKQTPPSLDTGETGRNVAAGRKEGREKLKLADKAKRRSGDKKSKRDMVASQESEDTEQRGDRIRKKEVRDKKKDKGSVGKRGAEAAEKNVSFSTEVATHHIPKDKQRTGIFGMFEKKDQKRKLATVHRHIPAGSVPASIHQQQKIAQRHQQLAQNPYMAPMPYGPQMVPAYYPMPMPQYVMYPPTPYQVPQVPQTQARSKGPPGHYMENFAEQTNLYY